jgi:hypothetical protein
MITKEDIKREIDRLPENLVAEVYAVLKDVVTKSEKPKTLSKEWFQNLDNFSYDFMQERQQPQTQEEREPLN